MTNEQIVALAKTEHYVNQLICGKYCFGRDYKMGCIVNVDGKQTTVRCGTVAELSAIGWVNNPQLIIIDLYIDNLETHKEHAARVARQ